MPSSCASRHSYYESHLMTNNLGFQTCILLTLPDFLSHHLIRVKCGVHCPDHPRYLDDHLLRVSGWGHVANLASAENGSDTRWHSSGRGNGFWYSSRIFSSSRNRLSSEKTCCDCGSIWPWPSLPMLRIAEKRPVKDVSGKRATPRSNSKHLAGTRRQL